VLVLDGQQRLQSSFLCFFGTHNDRELYVDVMTGQHKYDKEYDLRFYVRFLRGDGVKRFEALPAGQGRRMVRIKDFIDLAGEEMEKFAERRVAELTIGKGLSREAKHEAQYGARSKIHRIWRSLRDPQRVQVFTIDGNIQTTKDAKAGRGPQPNRSPARSKVQVASEGKVFSRSQ